MNQLTIVLADDHPVVRQGLRAVFESQDDLTVIGETSDGLETVQTVERLMPDVLVLDLMMPHLNGLEVVQNISKRASSTRVVILSMHRDESYVVKALQHGAMAYVLKDACAGELLRAVRAVAAGHLYFSEPFSEGGIQAYRDKAREAEIDSYDTLTEREREVLQLAAEGNSNPEIASRLFISPRTVETHRARLMQKLELHNHTDLIRYALKRGIISLGM